MDFLGALPMILAITLPLWAIAHSIRREAKRAASWAAAAAELGLSANDFAYDADPDSDRAINARHGWNEVHSMAGTIDGYTVEVVETSALGRRSVKFTIKRDGRLLLDRTVSRSLDGPAVVITVRGMVAKLCGSGSGT